LGVIPHRPDKYGWGGIWGVPACEALFHEKSPILLLRWCGMPDSPLISREVAPLSPPRAGYGKDEIRITVKESEILEESFRDLNQRLQRMGYKLIKNRYGWYWLKV